jgi:ABC-type nitrate/sulfonate/bicarbonate transport system substrate-binding protein
MRDKPIMIAQQSDMPASFVGPGNAGGGLASLKGLRIALPPEGQATTAVAIDALNKALGPKGYEPVFAGGGGSARVAALRSGAVDAAFVFAPLDGAVHKEDSKLNILASIDSGPTRYAGGVYVANASWLKKNAKAAAGWTKGYAKGCQWIQDPANKTEAVAILAKKMKLDTDVVEQAYDEYVANGDRSPSATGVVDIEGVKNVQSALISAGYQKKEVDVDSLVDNSYITGKK